MARRRGLGILVLSVLIGAIAGSAAGQGIGLIFGQFMPGSMVEKFFLESFIDYALSPVTIDFIVFAITFGFTIKINMISIFGIGVSVYYFRWY
ncbi:uncharacterized protein METZ01_LOCUS320888 [marine metagenome]|uniref:DUF4321 domain-containing protein n=1 Tax=marine metagenome TaxID=408172 RepID=A0A382P3P2_9ZZZZ